MSELTDLDRKLLSDIDQYGWHVVKVMGDETGPSFCYSVGLYATYNHPEIIIVGLNIDLAHALINDIGELIKNGERFEAGKNYSEVIANYECRMLEVSNDNFNEYVGYARWYYKEEFPLLQCAYPAADGSFPWDDACPENIKTMQPVLGTP